MIKKTIKHKKVKIQKKKQLKKHQLAIFLLVFAISGGSYLVYQGFALSLNTSEKIAIKRGSTANKRLVVKFKTKEAKNAFRSQTINNPNKSTQSAFAKATITPVIDEDVTTASSKFTTLNSNPRFTAVDKEALKKSIEPLTRYAYIDLPDTATATKALVEIENTANVEYAYYAPAPAPSPTPDYSNLQRYVAADSNASTNYSSGVLKVPGIRGQGVTIVDVEYSWQLDHEELVKRGIETIPPPQGSQYVDPYNDMGRHGAAVLGILKANPTNNSGIKGAVTDARIMVAGSNVMYADGFQLYDLPDALWRAAQRLNAGDVLLIEQQTIGPKGYDLIPVEWNPLEYEMIRFITSVGINVVQAAGNGGADLDEAIYRTDYSGRLGTFPSNRPDSGAIIVGAGGSTNIPECNKSGSDWQGGPRERLGFSTFGSRVNVQGVGECVLSTGYDEFSGSVQLKNGYGWFAGTSSASPVVASTVASLVAAYKADRGTVPTTNWVRERLIASGTPQATGIGKNAGKIGPLPNIEKAINFVKPIVVTKPTVTGLGGAPVSGSSQSTPLRVGTRLAFSSASFLYADSTAIQWQRCDTNLVTCRNIQGATNNQYTLVAADRGYRIRSTYVLTNQNGTTRGVTTNATYAVVAR